MSKQARINVTINNIKLSNELGNNNLYGLGSSNASMIIGEHLRAQAINLSATILM